jgi:hypothetical protein
MATDTTTTTTAARRQTGKKEREGGEIGGEEEEGDPPCMADGPGGLRVAAAIAHPGGQVVARAPGGTP